MQPILTVLLDDDHQVQVTGCAGDITKLNFWLDLAKARLLEVHSEAAKGPKIAIANGPIRG